MLALTLALMLMVPGQTATGELRLTVVDASGLPVEGTVELVSQSNQVRETLATDGHGALVARRLPFGSYRITVTREGFTPFAGALEIRSALPTPYRVTLSPAAIAAEVTVRPGETLMDPYQTVAVHRIDRESLEQRMASTPGRGLTDLVNAQPGWLLEANGILHPRGSEYQTQYVVDGLPLTDNRSPAFAPEIGADDVHGMNVLTAGYPAEYGRKLGGVIEVVTDGPGRRGFHGSAGGTVGSFATRSGDVAGGYGGDRTSVSVAAGVAASDRYLDPPVEENFSNRGTTAQGSLHLERDLNATDRIGMILRHGAARFTVPNERVQEDAGQRQDRDSAETALQFSYQHIFSAQALAEVRGMARDLSAGLRSNAASTPIAAAQDRGFREFYLKAAVTGHAGAHEWKAGGDVSAGTIREQFAYAVTDPAAFDPGTPAAFSFDGRHRDREQALFVQDQWRRGPWTVNAGVRWDRYRLLVGEHAISPRLGAAWSWPKRGLVLRASYDRAFQTPAVENLLLAGDASVDALNPDLLRLPVAPSRGNFYDAGFSKTFAGTARLDVSQYHRSMDNFADDDLLLNTGVSFPIAFRAARITGTEIRLQMPRWKTVSGSTGYSYMTGTGDLPITGGLFLGAEGEALAEGSGRFFISQDQRHTWRGRVSNQFNRSLWAAVTMSYDSGLPVEDFEGDRDEAIEQYGTRIVDRVDFEAGRVRPSFSVDASAGYTAGSTRKARVQIDVRNLTNRLNVINFAGLFSGTAVAAPRSFAVRLQVGF
jgi:hypothetical protein